MLHTLSALLLDQSCYSCGRNLVSQEKMICFDCLGQIEHTRFAERPTDNELYYRLAGKIPLAGATSLFYFDKAGRLQSLIQHIKYKGALPLARHLGCLLGQSLEGQAFCEAGTQIIPVPLHWRRRWQRGYNQATEIGRGLQKTTDMSLNLRVLGRPNHRQTQTRLSGQARWQNVSDVFRVQAEPPKQVLLLDDVITTGATLESCARALLAHPQPPTKIYIASIGMARKH